MSRHFYLIVVLESDHNRFPGKVREVLPPTPLKEMEFHAATIRFAYVVSRSYQWFMRHASWRMSVTSMIYKREFVGLVVEASETIKTFSCPFGNALDCLSYGSTKVNLTT